MDGRSETKCLSVRPLHIPILGREDGGRVRYERARPPAAAGLPSGSGGAGVFAFARNARENVVVPGAGFWQATGAGSFAPGPARFASPSKSIHEEWPAGLQGAIRCQHHSKQPRRRAAGGRCDMKPSLLDVHKLACSPKPHGSAAAYCGGKVGEGGSSLSSKEGRGRLWRDWIDRSFMRRFRIGAFISA